MNVEIKFTIRETCSSAWLIKYASIDGGPIRIKKDIGNPRNALCCRRGDSTKGTVCGHSAAVISQMGLLPGSLLLLSQA